MEIWRFCAAIVRLPLAFRLNQQWKYCSGIDINAVSNTDTPKGNMAAALTSWWQWYWHSQKEYGSSIDINADSDTDIIIDHFYIGLFSALEQTHGARMWFCMSE